MLRLIRSPIRQFQSSNTVRGLSEFFDTPKGWIWSDKEAITGRAWMASELRIKGFEDLHGLWWVCIKEMNKLESQKQEARRFQMYFPHKDKIHQVWNV
jgi:hypothetical protein